MQAGGQNFIDKIETQTNKQTNKHPAETHLCVNEYHSAMQCTFDMLRQKIS